MTPRPLIALVFALLPATVPLVGCSGDVIDATVESATSGGGGGLTGSTTSASQTSSGSGGVGGACPEGWGHVLGGASTQLARSLAVDGQGAVITSLQHFGGVALDGASLPGDPDAGYMLAKMDAGGALAWSLAFGGSTQNEFLPLAVDGHDDIVMGGSFYGSIDLGEGVTAEAPAQAALIAKVGPDGHPLWARGFPDDFAGADVVDLAVDGDGNIFFTGALYPGNVLDLGDLAVEGDFFVVKLDADGHPLWARGFTGGQPETHTLATTASGHVVMAGMLSETADFGGGALTSAGGFDIFLLELDAAGNHVFSRRFGDADLQRAFALTIDASNDIVLSGVFFNAIDLGGGVLESPGAYSAFVAKLDAEGEHLWSRRVPGAGAGVVSLAAPPSGGVTLAGSAYGPYDLGCGEIALDALEMHAFVAHLDDSGACVWHRDLGEGDEQVVAGVRVDRGGRAAVAGFYAGTIDLGSGPLASDGNDAFVATIPAPCAR